MYSSEFVCEQDHSKRCCVSCNKEQLIRFCGIWILCGTDTKCTILVPYRVAPTDTDTPTDSI